MSGALGEIATVFLKLGCTSFGGPVAHLGYFREELVKRRQWLGETAYADLVALCQFLPGPASSQVVFALGLQRAGLAGALTASLAFTLPSAVLMILFAYGVAALGDVAQAGWLHGLKVAAVAVVAQAVYGMAGALCPDAPRRLLAVAIAGGLLVYSGVGGQVAAIGVGALAGWLWYRHVPDIRPAAEVAGGGGQRRWGALALVVCAGLLVALPLLRSASSERWLAVFDSFYRSGALVFGGGHVVLPLLRAEVVPPGWMSDASFIAGYGAAQAVPGPLFTLSAYLGTVIFGGPFAWIGGLWALGAIFLPAWLLIGGALPFWSQLRTSPTAQAAMRGANAAVVGVLLAALYNPVGKEGIQSVVDLALAAAGFILLVVWKWPAWRVVVGAALLVALWPA